MKQSRF